MLEESRQMVCDRCRKSVPISDIKYIPRGVEAKIGLCQSCRVAGVVKNKASSALNDEAKKEEFYCVRCKYKFKYHLRSLSNFKCPYCGQSDQIAEGKVTTASHLINISTTSRNM